MVIFEYKIVILNIVFLFIFGGFFKILFDDRIINYDKKKKINLRNSVLEIFFIFKIYVFIGLNN